MKRIKRFFTMAKVILGSILVPDDVDADYLASLGLSNDIIAEALGSCESYQNDGEIMSMATYSEMQTENCSDDIVIPTDTLAGIFKSKVTNINPLEHPMTKHSDISEWKEFSMTPHTCDELRKKIMTDYDNVCFSYICHYSELPEEFIPELAALSTGMLTEDNYDIYLDQVIKAVMINNHIEQGKIDLKKLPKLPPLPEGKSKKGDKETSLPTVYGDFVFRDRLDWASISRYQKLSPAFRKKYDKLLNAEHHAYSIVAS